MLITCFCANATGGLRIRNIDDKAAHGRLKPIRSDREGRAKQQPAIGPVISDGRRLLSAAQQLFRSVLLKHPGNSERRDVRRCLPPDRLPINGFAGH